MMRTTYKKARLPRWYTIRTMFESFIGIGGVLLALLQATGPEKLAWLRKHTPEWLKWTMLVVSLGFLIVGIAGSTYRAVTSTPSPDEMRVPLILFGTALIMLLVARAQRRDAEQDRDVAERVKREFHEGMRNLPRDD